MWLFSEQSLPPSICLFEEHGERELVGNQHGSVLLQASGRAASPWGLRFLQLFSLTRMDVNNDESLASSGQMPCTALSSFG